MYGGRCAPTIQVCVPSRGLCTRRVSLDGGEAKLSVGVHFPVRGHVLDTVHDAGALPTRHMEAASPSGAAQTSYAGKVAHAALSRAFVGVRPSTLAHRMGTGPRLSPEREKRPYRARRDGVWWERTTSGRDWG